MVLFVFLLLKAVCSLDPLSLLSRKGAAARDTRDSIFFFARETPLDSDPKKHKDARW